MPSRWSTTVAKHGKLSGGRVARMRRQKDIHAALVGKSNAGWKQRSCLHCKNKGKEWSKPKPVPTCVHTHTLSDPTEAEVPQSDFFCSAYMGNVGWRFQFPNIGTRESWQEASGTAMAHGNSTEGPELSSAAPN